MSTFDLFSSVRDGNTDIVRRLLQSKSCRARLNDRNEWGDTALHLAAEAGNGEICQMLTAAGASVTVRNNRGETCLHRAAVGGHVEAVSAIVGRDQDPEAVNSQNDAGYTSLHHAAKHGSKELIDILVKAGADQMIENNAGETPYMVAHKYQQWDAERLLLNVEQQHADKAIREMNRKEKDIIRGYLNAVKYASHLESRIKIMLIGDTGSGKSSLKKTLSGEDYEPGEKPSSGINADPSVTRVTFKQFKEWVQQPSSKADTHRLNLEYIDAVIDYILNFIRQPQIVSDEHLDPNALQIEKEQVKTVKFNPEENVIPFEQETEEESLAESERNEAANSSNEAANSSSEAADENSLSLAHPLPVEGGLPDSQGKTDDNSLNERSEVVHYSPIQGASGICSEELKGHKTSPKKPSVTFAYDDDNDDVSSLVATPTTLQPEAITDVNPYLMFNVDEPDSSITSLDKEEGEYFVSVMNDEDEDFNSDDDRLHRLAVESRFTSFASDPNSVGISSLDHPVPRSGSLSSVDIPQAQNQTAGMRPSNEKEPSVQESPQSSIEKSDVQSSDKQLECTALIFNRTSHKLSRLLIEKLPMEILKRMVIRWPVGDEHHLDRSSLSSNRLAMTIWDSSGDPLQANFIPFFFSSRCFFVVSYNLSKDLDQPCLSYRKKNLTNIDGSIPTNAQVLESWLGIATAFTKKTPSKPYRCTKHTPLLPPIIIACTHSDHPSLVESPVLFHRFFDRETFKSYRKHLVEANCPSALRLSNRYETVSTRSEVELEVPYSGHHLLRREIEYLARQLPYIQDNIPVQWVKFEQLLYGLQQQRKLILLYDDIARYISEHCNLSGPLQVLPVLSHFHDLGIIVHFYRHPELSGIILLRPQWLISALGSIITSNPSRWITQEVQSGYTKLGQVGYIEKGMLLLAYRCARMGQKYWNEMLFILNCMDLITCHPSLHESKSVYIPAMVVQPSPDPHIIPSDIDPSPIHFNTLDGAAFPIGLFNQLVVRSIRSAHYNPVLYYKLAHLQLNVSHHLVLLMEHTSVTCLVQANSNEFCTDCSEKSTKYSFEPLCSSIEHLLGEDVELMPTDNLSTLIQNSTISGVNPDYNLAFPDDATFKQLCPAVLEFLTEHLQFLCGCWYPGLDIEQSSHDHDRVVILDQLWKHSVLYEEKADAKLAVWFKT